MRKGNKGREKKRVESKEEEGEEKEGMEEERGKGGEKEK